MRAVQHLKHIQRDYIKGNLQSYAASIECSPLPQSTQVSAHADTHTHHARNTSDFGMRKRAANFVASWGILRTKRVSTCKQNPFNVGVQIPSRLSLGYQSQVSSLPFADQHSNWQNFAMPWQQPLEMGQVLNLSILRGYSKLQKICLAVREPTPLSSLLKNLIALRGLRDVTCQSNGPQNKPYPASLPVTL